MSQLERLSALIMMSAPQSTFNFVSIVDPPSFQHDVQAPVHSMPFSWDHDGQPVAIIGRAIQAAPPVAMPVYRPEVVKARKRKSAADLMQTDSSVYVRELSLSCIGLYLSLSWPQNESRLLLHLSSYMACPSQIVDHTPFDERRHFFVRASLFSNRILHSQLVDNVRVSHAPTF